jgi:preprotein translocase subunit SecG
MALGLVEGNPSGFNTVFILAFLFSALCFLLSFTVTYEKKGLYGANRAKAPASAEPAADRPENAAAAGRTRT